MKIKAQSVVHTKHNLKPAAVMNIGEMTEGE